MLAGHTDDNPNLISLVGSGAGGLEELKSHLDETKVMYGVLRTYGEALYSWNHVELVVPHCVHPNPRNLCLSSLLLCRAIRSLAVSCCIRPLSQSAITRPVFQRRWLANSGVLLDKPFPPAALSSLSTSTTWARRCLSSRRAALVLSRVPPTRYIRLPYLGTRLFLLVLMLLRLLRPSSLNPTTSTLTSSAPPKSARKSSSARFRRTRTFPFTTFH
jgi:hypothetical protein